MYDCGTYPGLVEDADGVQIEGEVWEVDDECLALIDQIEGVDQGLYARREVELMDWNGDRVEAYLYLGEVEELKGWQ